MGFVTITILGLFAHNSNHPCHQIFNAPTMLGAELKTFGECKTLIGFTSKLCLKI